MSGIIGSGWLFSAYIGAKEAGSAVYLSWTLTLAFFILMALAMSEMISMFPVSGLVGRIGAISHNRFFGAIFSFAIWLELVGSMPGEAQASVQYLASVDKSISDALMDASGSLTFLGLLATFGFLVIYWLVNIFGLKFFAKVNNSIAVYKLVVPLATAFIIIAVSFDWGNFEAYHGEFMPYGFDSVITAITASGMIYAFNGFQLATAFAGEVKNPSRSLPLGMILSLVICFMIYIVLQTAFMGALDHDELVKSGWKGLNFNSPFVQLTSMLGLNFMTIILYTDACISPTGTGITFVGSASRVLYGMGAERQMPRVFSHIDPKLSYSKASMAFNFAVALLFLVLFHSWAVLIVFITALIVLMYMVIPIAIMGMRHAYPEMRRDFRLRFATPICTLLFVVQAMVMPFIGAFDVLLLTGAATLFMGVFVFINRPRAGGYTVTDVVATSLPFLGFMWILTGLLFLGPDLGPAEGRHGGQGIIGGTVLFIAIGVVAIVAFRVFTSKAFVLKCKVMREHDEVTLSMKRTE